MDVNIQASSGEIGNFSDMNTRLGIYAGTNEDISRVSLGDSLPEYSCAYFRFKTENPATVVEALQEFVEALKEFVVAINEELEPIVQQLEIEVVALEDGAAIVVNLDSHPILSPYVMMASMSTEPIKEFDPKVSLEIGKSKSLTDENFIGGKAMLRFNVNAKSVVDALLNNSASPVSKEIEAKLQGAVKQKMGIEVSTLLSLMNAKSLDLKLEMYDVDEEKVSMKFCAKDKIEGFLSKMKENPAMAVVATMEFLKEAGEALKENNVSEMNMGLSVGGVHLRVELKADIGFVLDSLFAEDDDDD